MIECCVCKKGPRDNVALFRINAKGVEGIFACIKHVSQTDASIDPEVRDLVKIIGGKSEEGEG